MSTDDKCYNCGGTVDTCECDQFVICECFYVDVDEVSARDCLAHGPRSQSAKEWRKREAADEAAFWGGGPI
jgi:hypothetical protein